MAARAACTAAQPRQCSCGWRRPGGGGDGGGLAGSGGGLGGTGGDGGIEGVGGGARGVTTAMQSKPIG